MEATVGMTVYTPYVSTITMNDGIPYYFIAEGTVSVVDGGRLAVKSPSGYFSTAEAGDSYPTKEEAMRFIVKRLRYIAASIMDAANAEESKVGAEPAVTSVGASAEPKNAEDER